MGKKDLLIQFLNQNKTGIIPLHNLQKLYNLKKRGQSVWQTKGNSHDPPFEEFEGPHLWRSFKCCSSRLRSPKKKFRFIKTPEIGSYEQKLKKKNKREAVHHWFFRGNQKRNNLVYIYSFFIFVFKVN